MNEHCKSCSNRKKQIGKKPSLETKLKMSLAKKGKKPKNLGVSFGLSGKGNPQWKGGITEINHRIRTSLEYKLVREACFKRDNYTCIWCGQRGGRLNADHIKPFSLFPELRLALDNLRTLCESCHKKVGWKGSWVKK